MKWRHLHLLVVIAALTSVSRVRAEEVEFPEEELARESVLPVFENPRDVLNRRVNTTGHFEIGVGGGMDIDEPFYNAVILKGHVGYHFTELHGVTLEGVYWMPGLSSYGQQLKNDNTLKDPANQALTNWDVSKAPHPLWGTIGNYEFTAYYGKISITKQFVMNLNLFVYGGGLYINMNGYNSFGGDIGLGQNFFITPSVAVRFDLRMLIYQGPNAAAMDLYGNNNPAVSSYPTRIFYNNQAGLSLVMLL